MSIEDEYEDLFTRQILWNPPGCGTECGQACPVPLDTVTDRRCGLQAGENNSCQLLVLAQKSCEPTDPSHVMEMPDQSEDPQHYPALVQKKTFSFFSFFFLLLHPLPLSIE